jgi:hypothetical protein
MEATTAPTGTETLTGGSSQDTVMTTAQNIPVQTMEESTPLRPLQGLVKTRLPRQHAAVDAIYCGLSDVVIRQKLPPPKLDSTITRDKDKFLNLDFC